MKLDPLAKIAIVAIAAASSACIDAKPDHEQEPLTDPYACRDGVQTVVTRFSPVWLDPGPFKIDTPSPGNVQPPSWRAYGDVPKAASFSVPFQAGDTIVDLGWDAHGEPTNKGLGEVDVLYLAPVGSERVFVSAQTHDTDRAPRWGTFEPRDFHPVKLADDGALWVTMRVEAIDYAIGLVTATFKRPCR